MLAVPLLAAAALAAPPVTLTAADNGRVVRLARATPVVLRLVENPSTGYRWKLLTPLDARVVKLVAHRFQAPRSGSPPGAPGVSVWRFTSVGRGRTALRLGYLRSWEPRNIVKRFHVDFRVS
jgi:inhibitor of cysteine peptidase